MKMREWKYLLFLARYHAERLLKKFLQRGEGVYYSRSNVKII